MIYDFYYDSFYKLDFWYKEGSYIFLVITKYANTYSYFS